VENSIEKCMCPRKLYDFVESGRTALKKSKLLSLLSVLHQKVVLMGEIKGW